MFLPLSQVVLDGLTNMLNMADSAGKTAEMTLCIEEADAIDALEKLQVYILKKLTSIRILINECIASGRIVCNTNKYIYSVGALFAAPFCRGPFLHAFRHV